VSDESRFVGLSHEELLRRQVPSVVQLVEDVVEAGTIGAIAALPGRYKSWVALELGFKVARNNGARFLGEAAIVKGGPVGYWWQDDSEANELTRIHAYARHHKHTGQLPIRWHLNEGLRLPDDIPRLADEIRTEKQVLVVLDSLYNFLPGVNLKDEEVAGVLQRLKADVCDPTGCTICYVDHAPWPSESNRNQRRGYGSVFKAAAIRWGIFLEKPNSTLWLEASGNNVLGIKRSIAVWDEDELELRLTQPKIGNDARVRELRAADPHMTQEQVSAALDVSVRTVRKYWHDEPQESLLDEGAA
jgi:RecA-family ATPase